MKNKNSLKIVQTSQPTQIKEEDKRSHDEKISALYVAFGRHKELARSSGMVNDCSINKICAEVGIDKNWIHGHRKDRKNQKVNEKYQTFGDEVNTYRDNFSPNKEISKDKALLADMILKYEELKNSFEPKLTELVNLKKAARINPFNINELKDNNDLLKAEIIQLKHELERIPRQNLGGEAFQEKIIRTIISPDKYRYVSGKYIFGDKKIEQKAWAKTFDDLYEALSRNLKMRLYVLVGLPFSGKSIWSEKSYLEPDRIPVIFDSTNLTEDDRLKLIHPLKRIKDVPKVCVFFDTDIEIIRKRNYQSDGFSRAKLTDDGILYMQDELEKPNPYTEGWIDDLRVIRQK